MSTKETPTGRVCNRLYTVIKEEEAKDDVDVAALIVGLAVTMSQLVKQGYASKEEVRGALEIALRTIPLEDDEYAGNDEDEDEE